MNLNNSLKLIKQIIFKIEKNMSVINIEVHL